MPQYRSTEPSETSNGPQRLLPSPKASVQSPLQSAWSRHNSNEVHKQATTVHSAPSAHKPRVLGKGVKEGGDERASCEGGLETRSDTPHQRGAAARPVQRVPVVVASRRRTTSPTGAVSSSSPSAEKSPMTMMMTTTTIPKRQDSGKDIVGCALRRLLELLRSDPSEPLPSLPTEGEVKDVPMMWDCFQEARMVKEASRRGGGSQGGASLLQEQALEKSGEQLRSAQRELDAAQHEAAKHMALSGSLQRRLDEALKREEAQSSRVVLLEAEMDKLQCIVAERERERVAGIKAREQLTDAMQRMDALESALAAARVKQDIAPPPLAKARVWDASCQSDAPAYCQAEVQATVAHCDGQVQADANPSLATADAICGTEDLAEADAKREAATSAEIESLQREVADRRRVTSKLVDVVAARSSAPPGYPQWAGIPRLSVLIVRADGLPGGLGQLRCEASLTGQAESRAWTCSAVCTLTGGCAWGDVLTLSVDGEVVSPQDLQVCVIDASGSGEFGAGRGVVGVLRVPLLSVEHHVCDSAPSEDPDKWTRLKLPLEETMERGQSSGQPPSLLVGLSFAKSGPRFQPQHYH